MEQEIAQGHESLAQVDDRVFPWRRSQAQGRSLPKPSFLRHPRFMVALHPTQDAPAPEREHGSHKILSPRHARAVMAIAEAAMPAGKLFDAPGSATIRAFDTWLASIPPEVAKGLLGAIWTIELSTLVTHLRPFSSLSLSARMKALLGWEQSSSHAARTLLRSVLTPLKLAHMDRPEMFHHVGCRYELETVCDEQPRWLAQVMNGREIEEELELECEVVVIGTGAGGAAAAYELASRGRAVLLLEEGDYHRRSSFNARTSRAYKNLYRDQALTVAIGNAPIPLWAGRAVGGSTVINSGTCYRAPERTFAYWRSRHGLPLDFSSQAMDPYYRRVEAMLQVTPANPLHTGTIGPIIARGASRLGLHHDVLMRNAPDCDGQGVCCFGCPTGAKRSTDVSYVPAALMKGAQLITAAHVDTVDIVSGRACGVTASLGPKRADGKRPRLRVKASAVVVACGALQTPLLLGRSKACRTSGMLGKNLSLHPASKVFALFDERVDQWKGIPQGVTIDHFADEGLLFEGGSVPLDIAALGVPWTGARYTELMEQYSHLATFGFMIQDHSRGSVRPGLRGSPLIQYHLQESDVARMQRGFEILCEVFQKAGARRVLPLIVGSDEINSDADLAALKRRKLAAGDFEVTAFHPLGTCRIGADPRRSCLGPEHEAHDVESLYVCDGSAIPSSLGVNPQMTIMAMALRAAEIIDRRLA